MRSGRLGAPVYGFDAPDDNDVADRGVDYGSIFEGCTLMPITFRSKHSPNILMLDSVALELIKKMGHSGSVPGSLAADDVAAALDKLNAALARAAAATGADAPDDDEREDGPAVSLAHRALPLVEMLEKARAAGDYVIWDR